MPRTTVGRALVPSFSKVDTGWERDHYWKVLTAMWGVPSRRAQSKSYHPGSNPCSLSRSSLPSLGRSRYGITLKSDGVRYSLLLTTRPTRDGEVQPVALMIDRARHMYEVELLAPEAFYTQGTLLEGELVWRQPGQNDMLFLVFDAVRVCGTNLLPRPFHERLAEATRCTRWSEELAGNGSTDLQHRLLEADTMALVHYDPPLSMRPKRFVDCKHAVRLWEERHDSEHRVDGIILQSLDAAYKCGTAEDGSVYKWKEHSTVDLRVMPDRVLRAADGPLPARLHDRAVTVEDDGEGHYPVHTVVEYLVEVTDVSVRLTPLRTRPDKTDPNGLRVVEATVKDVIEGITPYDLASVSADHDGAGPE